MKSTLLFILLLFVYVNVNAQVWQPSDHTQILIWPKDKMSDALPVIKTESITAGTIWDVTQPTMTIYSPKGKNTDAAVIVFPGGGFHGLAIDLEGTEYVTG